VFLRRCALLAIVVLLACNKSNSPTAPGDPASLPHGRLAGVVTIGPNCPVQTDTNPCPTPPSAYGLRKVLVYDEKRTKLLFTVDIDEHGLYLIDLVPAKYVIDLKTTGIDKSGDVPANVTIQNNVVTKLDIRVDTGLR
jgi:hypothetical protein